ncbi:MAG: hypothetical protein AAFO07_18605 [Bacteroidota bacterium]
MISIRYILCWLVFCSCTLGCHAQSLSGVWKGYITIEGLVDSFLYEVYIDDDGKNINGNSYCYSTDTSSQARFILFGSKIGDHWILQEYKQTEPDPKDNKWCHKYMRLNYEVVDGQAMLTGKWTATNCNPGQVVLKKQYLYEQIASTQNEAFKIEGVWRGALGQSDRNYDFDLEVTLKEGGVGTAKIKSRGVGGDAEMELKWYLNEDGEVEIEETTLTDQSITSWRWCIKNYLLKLKKENMDTYSLKGKWDGYINGYNKKTGPCAPGVMELFKTMDAQPEPESIRAPLVDSSLSMVERKVEIQRVIEVKSTKVRLRAWDNGTVDGDIVTIFLNGDEILFRHRVNKSRYAMPITLLEKDNFMILYADDIGSISPNTVAVSIDDGIKEHQILLSADLDTNGAVLIRKVELEE